MKRTIFLLGIFIFAFGCSDEILNSDPTLDSGNLRQTLTKYVPIKGEVLVTHQYDDQGVALPYGNMSGYISHLGKLNEMKTTWTGISNDFSQFPPLITFVNDVVLCAANGDLLYTTYTGILDVTTFEVTGSLVFDGGTGRFENASGQMSADGYAMPNELGNPEGMYLAGEGEISNVGSGK